MDIQLRNTVQLEPVPTRYGKEISPQNSQHIKEFNLWCEDILNPDLVAYRDYLASEERNLSPASILAHLTNIRRAYKALLKDRDLFYDRFAPSELSPANRKAIVDEKIERIKDGLEVSVKQHSDDTEQGYRMSVKECVDFMRLFDNPKHLLIVQTLLSTGMRISELVRITPNDCRHNEGNEPAIKIRNGKHNTSRAIVLGGMYKIRDMLLEYAAQNDIGDDSPIFPMTTRAIEYLITRKAYQPAKANEPISAHDCRRTYARLLFDNAMPVKSIQENMGHKSISTTLSYIGKTDIDSRKPLNLFGW